MKRLFYLLLAFLLISCSHKDKKELPTKIYKESQTMNFKDYLGKTYSLEIIGKYLITRDDQVETKLTIFDIEKTPAHPIYTGYVGQGPGELINPGPIIVESNEFYIYDASKMQLLSFNIDSIEIANYKPHCFVPIKETGIIDIKQIDSDIFVAVGVFPEKRLKLINKQGNTTYSSGSYPIELIKDVPEYVRGIACQSMLTSNRQKHTIAIAMRYGEHIQFYSIDSHKFLIELINERNIFLPKYTTRDNNGFPNFSPSEKTRWGYISITSNNNYVYALYSGKFQVRGTDFYKGTIIHVFDWDGNLVKIIELDKGSLSITCNQKELYSLYEGEDGFEIAKYNL
jgi:hypothetical protein